MQVRVQDGEKPGQELEHSGMLHYLFLGIVPPIVDWALLHYLAIKKTLDNANMAAGQSAQGSSSVDGLSSQVTLGLSQVNS